MPRSIAAICLLALLVSACGTSSSAPKPTPTKGRVAIGVPAAASTSILLDWYPNSDHGGLYTALRGGYFSKKNVFPIVRVPSNATGQIELVAAGKADFAITYEADLLAARARGLPVRSVMCIAQHPLNTVMSLASTGIHRPRQLVGRTVGMAGSPSDEPIIRAMMTKDGTSIGETKMVNVGYNLLPALLAKKVDAVVGVYWTWERIQAQMRGFPVNVMRVEQWGVPNYCELVLITQERTIHNAPALVRSVVQSLQAGYRDAERNPQKAWKALMTADPTLRKQRSLVTRSIVLLRGAIDTGPTIGYQDPSQWNRYARWLVSDKLLSHTLDAKRAFTNQFLQDGVH